MELVLKRIAKKEGYTIGRLSLNEKLKIKNEKSTLEDEKLNLGAEKPDEAKNSELITQNSVYLCDTLEPP